MTSDQRTKLKFVIPLLLSLVLGKKSVFKLIKSSSAELSDLSLLKDTYLESSICVARKVVAKL
jgi:hypothetical protein